MTDEKDTPTAGEDDVSDAQPATDAPPATAPSTGVVDEALSDADEVSADAIDDAESEPEPALDLAELGRRYEVSANFAERLRGAFRELKRHPSEAKRLPALLRGLARAHQPEAQRAAEQITRLVERIQAPAKDT